MEEEFYAIAFRKKLYNTLEELQSDIDQWVNFYHIERPHSGRYCFGKTPMQTFAGSKDLAQNKNLNSFFRPNAIFKLSDQTQTGSVEEQPVGDSLTDENNKALENHQPLSKNYFQSNA